MDLSDALYPLSLEELLNRPKWQRDAACVEHDPALFHPDRGQPSAPAKAICGRCLVVSECLSYALEHRVQGIWGGTSERERNQLRRTVPDAA